MNFIDVKQLNEKFEKHVMEHFATKGGFQTIDG